MKKIKEELCFILVLNKFYYCCCSRRNAPALYRNPGGSVIGTPFSSLGYCSSFSLCGCHSLYEMELSLQAFSFLFHRWNSDSCVKQMLTGTSRQGHWIYVSPSTLTWSSRQPHPAIQKRLKIKRFGPSQLCNQTAWRLHLVSFTRNFLGQIAYPGYKTKR